MESDSENDFEGFNASDINDYDGNYSDESDVSVSDVSSVSDLESESSDSENDLQLPDRWTENLQAVQKHLFTGPEPGATVGLHAHKKEEDFLNLFFPKELFETAVEQTNLYATQQQRRRGRDPNWTPVTLASLKAWFGIRLLMSIIHLPTTNIYWSRGIFGVKCIYDVMKGFYLFSPLVSTIIDF